MRRLLVIEDQPELRQLLVLHLRDAGYDVVEAAEGREGLEAAARQAFDLIILDLMLPEIDGLEICRRVRASDTYTPILILTAKSTELDRVVGLEIGADDYVTKPFSIRELVARVKAILRRIEAVEADKSREETIVRDDLHIELTRREVRLGEAKVRLTAKEFDLLCHFARHPGRVFRRSDLLQAVWGYGHEGYEHTVNSHINRLRGKIEDDPASPKRIETVWGVGYRFAVAGSPLLPGRTVTLSIDSGDAPYRRISFVAMLVTTNDAFAAVNSYFVPPGQGRVKLHAYAWDAGSENNNEDCDFIPGPPCGNAGVRDQEEADGFAHIHRGVHGIGDLDSSMLDWYNPVASVLIREVGP